MTAVVDERPVDAGVSITEPGVYTLDEDTYHGDPVPGGSLSSTGARRLLAPSCPAKFAYEREHGRPNKRAFDFGHAAHQAVLGVGAPLVVVDAADWRTKAAREAQAAAYAAGQVPILVAEHEQVLGMAAALRAHPIAGALFDPARGEPEQSLFYREPRHGVMLRGRLDQLPASARPSGRLILADYKTALSAERDAVAKAMASWGYHQQAAWYADLVTALGLADTVAFVFVFQEKTKPYLISVAEPDPLAVRIGRHLNERAIGTYAQCTGTGSWPGYSDDVELVSLPPWVANQYPELMT